MWIKVNSSRADMAKNLSALCTRVDKQGVLFEHMALDLMIELNRGLMQFNPYYYVGVGVAPHIIEYLLDGEFKMYKMAAEIAGAYGAYLAGEIDAEPDDLEEVEPEDMEPEDMGD